MGPCPFFFSTRCKTHKVECQRLIVKYTPVMQLFPGRCITPGALFVLAELSNQFLPLVLMLTLLSTIAYLGPLVDSKDRKFL